MATDEQYRKWYDKFIGQRKRRSMKFKPGDQFRVIENGITGIVISVNSKYGPNGTEHSYNVTWDYFSRNTYDYPSEEADVIWEKLEYNVGYRVGVDFAFAPVTITVDDVKAVAPTCETHGHEWIMYVGFTRSFDYCKRCDVKR